MRKKMLTVCLSAAMVMSLAACGSSKDTATSADTAAEVKTETVEVQTEAKTEAETAAACSHCQGARHGTQDDAF